MGQRLLRARKFLANDEMFLANYSDGLSDLPLDQMIADFKAKNCVASFASVRSWMSFHAVESGPDGYVTRIGAIRDAQFMINGGFFVMKRQIFDYLNEGEELVEQPFARLCAERLLATYRYEGFWMAMDTYKDKITLDRMEAQGNCPWMVWKR